MPGAPRAGCRGNSILIPPPCPLRPRPIPPYTTYASAQPADHMAGWAGPSRGWLGCLWGQWLCAAMDWTGFVPRLYATVCRIVARSVSVYSGRASVPRLALFVWAQVTLVVVTGSQNTTTPAAMTFIAPVVENVTTPVRACFGSTVCNCNEECPRTRYLTARSCSLAVSPCSLVFRCCRSACV